MFVFNLCVIRLNDDEIEIGWKQKLWQKYVSSICWLVVLLAAKHKNYWTDFHKNLDGGFHTSSINFWYKSRQRDVFFHFLWPCEKKIWRIYMAGVYQWVTKGDSWRSYELYWGSILVIKWVTCQFLFSAQRGQNHPTREESTDWIQINVAGFFSSLLHWTRHNPSDWSRDPFRGPTSRLGTAGPNCLIACKVVTPASSLHQHSC